MFWCVLRLFKKVLNCVVKCYGKVIVYLIKCWWLENWWKGGVKNFYYLNCQVVDFFVWGNFFLVVVFLKVQLEVGGYKYYFFGYYYIDIGLCWMW